MKCVKEHSYRETTRHSGTLLPRKVVQESRWQEEGLKTRDKNKHLFVHILQSDLICVEVEAKTG
jgi:hypothetical protein